MCGGWCMIHEYTTMRKREYPEQSKKHSVYDTKQSEK
jgi:hypothetical protein